MMNDKCSNKNCEIEGCLLKMHLRDTHWFEGYPWKKFPELSTIFRERTQIYIFDTGGGISKELLKQNAHEVGRYCQAM